MIGEFWDALRFYDPGSSPLVAIFSDHGQIQVVPDDRHSLRLAFPFEREMAHLFDRLGLDVHDFPGEDPNCDAVVCANGGLAYVYLQNRTGIWADYPNFERDVRPVGKAFWEAHQSGKYAAELHGALAGVLVRNVETQGWKAPYRALSQDGEVVSLEQWFANRILFDPGLLYADPIHRLNHLSGAMSGDMLLISNYAEGYYFGAPLRGVHGGLHPEDSAVTLALGFPGMSEDDLPKARQGVLQSLHHRCRSEGGREPSTADLLTCLLPVLSVA
jgi:hypothetical protein